jgi:hypothetical protein
VVYVHILYYAIYAYCCKVNHTVGLETAFCMLNPASLTPCLDSFILAVILMLLRLGQRPSISSLTSHDHPIHTWAIYTAATEVARVFRVIPVDIERKQNVVEAGRFS